MIYSSSSILILDSPVVHTIRHQLVYACINKILIHPGRLPDSTFHLQYKLWSRRLTVRTPGFHPGNRGSIPRGITKQSHPPQCGCFCLVLSCVKVEPGVRRQGASTDACIEHATQAHRRYSPRDHYNCYKKHSHIPGSVYSFSAVSQLTLMVMLACLAISANPNPIGHGTNRTNTNE